MTVSTTSNKITYAGNGATTIFGFTFPAVAASDLQVFFTDATGVVTLLASNLYSVALFPAVAPNPTAFGGNVTYPLIGSPIATGTSLTILRTLPETQPVSLANQSTAYQAAIEQALDYQTMLVQQLQELLGRQIAVAVSDPAPGLIPAVANRANLAFGWDSSGNPTAIATLPAGTVSSAWAPVVGSASLAAGLALLGLTGVAPEPSGVVKAFAGSVIPSGYLGCFGQAVSRTGATAALFAAIGTTYGVGDGVTTFNVPDLRGRVIANLDNQGGIAANRLTATSITGGATTLGNSGGAETQTISVAQLPSHNHGGVTGGTQDSFRYQKTTTSGGGPDNITGVFTTSSGLGTTTLTQDSHTHTVASQGGGSPTVTVEPTMIMNYIIKT